MIDHADIYIDIKAPLRVPVLYVHKGDPLPLPDKYKKMTVTSKKSSYDMLALYIAFDIETTTWGEEHHGYMYHAQFGICSDYGGCILMTRTWEDTMYVFDEIIRKYNLSRDRRAICWIANLGFEFSFLQHRLPWDQNEFAFFAKEKRAPMLATTSGLELRDALQVCRGSLSNLCKAYTVTQKAVGDLRYDLPRISTTPLSDQEVGYCVNDIIPLCEFSARFYSEYIAHNKSMPLTETSILRGEVHDEFDRLLKGKFREQYKKLLKMAYPRTLRFYKILVEPGFRGGFVHGNATYVNQVIYNVISFDITSSYPAQMLISGRFPGGFKQVHPSKLPEILEKDGCFLGHFTFYNVRRTTPHSIESFDKVDPNSWDGVILDNGRIYGTEKNGHFSVWLNSDDFAMYKLFYRWDECTCDELYEAPWIDIPPYVLNILKKYYLLKAKLKREHKDDLPEYRSAKSKANSFFGMMITKLCETTWGFFDGWYETPSLNFEQERDKAILLPQIGVFIASHARRALLEMVYKLESTVGKDYPGGVVLYCDTDSCKCLYDERIPALFEEYNEKMRQRRIARGLTDEGFEGLGEFDREGKSVDKIYTRFKCLGCKRYITEEIIDGKPVIKATVAGMPKKTIHALGMTNDEIFEKFTLDGALLDDIEDTSRAPQKAVTIDAEDSDKRTHAWHDEAHEDVVTDYLGNSEVMHEESSCGIYDIPFSIGISRDFWFLLQHKEHIKRRA